MTRPARATCIAPVIRNRSADRSLLGRGATVLCAALAVAACSQFSAEGLLLRSDESITITSPRDRSTTSVPLIVEWTDDDPRAGGAYAVIIDRTPMPPGEPVTWFARNDENCQPTQACPDARWLAIRGVTVTDELSAMIEIVPTRGESRADGFYEITIVRLDAQGRREGEAAFAVRVRVER